MKRPSSSIPRLAAAAGMGLMLCGCHRKDAAADHGVDHDHSEPKTAQITVWTDRYEVFAEHRAFVAGQPVQLVTHVTDLQSLEPRRRGPVKFVMRQGEAVAEHSEPAPARDGIYLPKLSLPKPGEWRITVLVPTDGPDVPLELSPVKAFADAHAAAHAEFPEPPEGISFLKEQQWKVLTKAEPVAKRRVVERVKLAAQTLAKPGFSVSVVAPLAGQILAPGENELPLPGQRVEAGQLLALLRPSFSEAAAKFAESEGEFARAKAALEKAELAFERTRKLAERKAKSERELQDAELAWQTARANHETASALRATYRQLADPKPGGNASGLVLELRAPIAGVVNHIGAGLGEPVPADHAVFQILNPDVLWIEARVPETALGRLADDGDASFALPGTSEFLSVKANGGRRVFGGLQIDSTTRTVPFLYEVNNPGNRLRIGESLLLHVETARAEDTLAVPDSAIVEEGGQPVAFVQVAGETFQKRELKLGIRDGNWVQVLSGLAEGERVVTKSAYAIRLSSISGVIPAHGHAH